MNAVAITVVSHQIATMICVSRTNICMVFPCGCCLSNHRGGGFSCDSFGFLVCCSSNSVDGVVYVFNVVCMRG